MRRLSSKPLWTVSDFEAFFAAAAKYHELILELFSKVSAVQTPRSVEYIKLARENASHALAALPGARPGATTVERRAQDPSVLEQGGKNYEAGISSPDPGRSLID